MTIDQARAIAAGIVARELWAHYVSRRPDTEPYDIREAIAAALVKAGRAEQRAKLAEAEANAARRILNRMGGYTGHDDPVSVWLANCDIYRAARTARKGKKGKP